VSRRLRAGFVEQARMGETMGSRVPAVVAVTVTVVVAGGAAAFAGGSDQSRTTRLAVQVTTTRLTPVDTGPPGSSPGDMVVEDDTVTREGQPFGTAQFTCIAHAGDLANGNAECTGTLYLPQGQIETQGGATSTNGAISGKGAVTGGTDRYHGIRGSYSFESTTATQRVVRFKLIR
jgi:hypothetical protein